MSGVPQLYLAFYTCNSLLRLKAAVLHRQRETGAVQKESSRDLQSCNEYHNLKIYRFNEKHTPLKVPQVTDNRITLNRAEQEATFK